jgi:hypothetical protein
MASGNALILTKRMADAYFTGTFKFLLVSSVPSEANFDAYDFRDDIANEVTGTGYTSGGVAATVTVGSVDTTNDRTPVTITDLTNAWTSSTISAVGGWLYKVVGSAATDQLVGFVDFGGTVTSTAGNFSVAFTTPLYVNG